jgi:hypothetical protein
MPPRRVVIDLTLDSDDEDLQEVPAVNRMQREETPEDYHDAAPEGRDLDFWEELQPMPGQYDEQQLRNDEGNLRDIPLVIDDFGYLDEEPQQQPGAQQEEQDAELARNLDNEQQTMTQDACLARIYDVFPDICPEHTQSVYDQVSTDVDYELLPAQRLDRIIEKLIADGPYPKRPKNNQHLKRKREESAEDEYKRWESNDREGLPRFLSGSIRTILKADFPTFTQTDINEIVLEKKYLFKSYVRLAELRDTDGNPRRGRPSTAISNADTIVANSGWPPLEEELAAARKRAQADRVIRDEEKAKKRAEDDNLRRSIAKGRTAECQACFDDLPTNRQVHCHGDEPHYTCFSCIETYIKTEIGDARCRVLCTAGCGVGFEPAQLNLLADKKLLKKLADLQQEKDIRDAGLDDLEECPFCDYKVIMPPIEENFEFTCANPECEKVSCRRCKFTTHIPMSCEQYAKEKNANSRHTIEEAMTAAMVRSCNKCKKQFIKDFGCNKMTCPSCRNLQCYVCSETLKGYDHFDQTPQGDPRPGGKCPLYDNLEERHEREVAAAEEATRAKVIAANPDVAPEDLEIKVSDAVKQSTAQRIQRAGPQGLGGGPARWGGAAGAMNAVIRGFADDDDDDNPFLGILRHPGARPVADRRPLPMPDPNEHNRLRIQQQGRLRLQQRREDRQGDRHVANAQEVAQMQVRLQLAQNAHFAQRRREAELRQAYEMADVNNEFPVFPDRDERARARVRQRLAAAARPPGGRFPQPRGIGEYRPPNPMPDGPLLAPGQDQEAVDREFQILLQAHRNLAQRARNPRPPPPPPQPVVQAPPPPPQIQRPPPAEYLELAQHYNPLPPNAVHDGREEARLANVARNLHQLELMRLQHDARQGLPEVELRERPRRRRLE